MIVCCSKLLKISLARWDKSDFNVNLTISMTNGIDESQYKN